MTARRSLLAPTRGELASLISVTMGREAARTFRAGNRHAPRVAHPSVPDSAWHPATQLTSPRRDSRTGGEGGRGNAEDRRRRKLYLLNTWGDGFQAPCAFCKAPLVFSTMTVDRFPVPGREGARYTRDNIRPACEPCNKGDQGRQALGRPRRVSA